MASTPQPQHAPLPGALSFRKEPRVTGLAGIGQPHPDTHVKVAGVMVGRLCGPNAFSNLDGWTVSVMVHATPTKESPCPWRWVRFKQRWPSEAEARAWTKTLWPQILASHNVYRETEK